MVSVTLNEKDIDVENFHQCWVLIRPGTWIVFFLIIIVRRETEKQPLEGILPTLDKGGEVECIR